MHGFRFASPARVESGILNGHGESDTSRWGGRSGRKFRSRPIAQNLRVIRRHIGPKPQILAVVKSNAYGLGAVPVSKALQKAGADWFGVTCANEGIELRESGIRKPILVLTGFWPGEEKRLIRTA